MEDKKFEELMSELENIIKELETGNTDLESSIKKYTEAMQIVKVCNDKLTKATDAVNQILKENGELEEFRIEELFFFFLFKIIYFCDILLIIWGDKDGKRW